jgi:hypothetical protein
MAITTTSDLSPKVQAYYDTNFLIRVKNKVGYWLFGQKRSLPKGKGKTIYFTRYKPLPKRIEPLTQTRDGGVLEGKKIETTEINATIEEYGDYAEISELASLTSIDPGVKEKTDIMAQQASDTIDELVKRVVGTGLMRRRADGNNAYQKNVTATGGSVTTITTNLGEADDFWNGGYVTFTNPMDANYGITAQVTAFSEGILTLNKTLNQAPSADISKFRLVVGTGINSANTLTTKALKEALKDLKKAKAAQYDGQGWVCLVDPSLLSDLMDDPDWKNVATYKDSAKNLYNGEIGKWLNIRFVEVSEIYRESVAGIRQDEGDVYVATLLGKEAYGVVELAGDQKRIYVRTAKELGQPLEMTSTVGWKIGFTTTILNGNFGVNILCGASS